MKSKLSADKKLKIKKRRSSICVFNVLNSFDKNGFTLLELLVVFVIIAIISTVSLAAFVSYNKIQTIKSAAFDVISLLQDAKSRTQSQVKPSIAACNSNTLDGYEVRICGLTGSLCNTQNTYELHVRCGNLTSKLSTKTLPANVTFDSATTTSTQFIFKVISGGVDGAGSVGITGYNNTLKVTVTQQGAIILE